jgi:hypothetical protein
MSGKFEGIVVMRLGVSVSEQIQKELQAAVEKTCQALGIRHSIDDRRESEGWTRSICILSPQCFARSAEAFHWAKETACQIAEHFQRQGAVSSRKYCGVWIDVEENISAQEEERQEESGEDLEERGGQG